MKFTKHKIQKFKILTILGVLAILGLEVNFISKQIEVMKLQRLLSDVSISSLKVEGRNYILTNGKLSGKPDLDTEIKVLRLASFYQWDKEDPLFDSPDLDPQAVLEATNVLDENQNELLKLLNKPYSLFPTSFLRSLSQASVEDRAFLKSPSDSFASDLLKEQYQAAQAYLRASQTFLNLEDQPSKQIIAMFNTATTEGLVRDDYTTIVRNAEALQQEISHRQACLEKSECLRPLANLGKPTLLKTSNEKPALLDKRLIKEQTLRASNVTLSGPYQVQTFCFGFNDDLSVPYQYFYLASMPADSFTDKSYLELFLATNIYFRKLPPENFPNIDPVDLALIVQGQKYTIQSATAPYVCPDSEYLNEVLELHHFLLTYQPILQNIQVSPDAKKAEEDLFTAQIPSYGQLQNLGDYYGYLYTLAGNQSLKEKYLTRYLAIKGKMADFDKLLIREIPYTRRLIEAKELAQPEDGYSIDYVYAIRGNYGLMYLPFTPVVWRLSQPLSYIQKRIVEGAVSPKGGYLTYTQASLLYPQTEIKSWFTDPEVIYRQLINMTH